MGSQSGGIRLHVADIPLSSALIDKDYEEWENYQWCVHAHLSAEVREWCTDHIGPIVSESHRHIAYENEIILDTVEIVLNTDLIRVTFASFADFIAFKMRWL
jgi:hypothetical protein